MRPIPNLDFSTPWYITPDAGRDLSALYARSKMLQSKLQDENQFLLAMEATKRDLQVSSLCFGENESEDDGNGRLWDLHNGVATINCRGPIMRYSSWWSEWLGMASVQSLANQLQEVRSDSRVHAVIFNFDSPGGQGNGLSELADAINDLGEEKEVVAYVDNSACSAAYWFAAACNRIVTSPLGMSGSIGSVLITYDDTDYLKQMGLEEIVIRSSQSPNKWPDAATKEGRALYQDMVDRSAQVFGEAVAEYRNVSIETVWNEFGKGWVMTGQQAVDAGLCDELGDYESLLEELASARGSATARNNNLNSASFGAKGVMNMGNNKPETQQVEQEASVPVSAIGAVLAAIGFTPKSATPSEGAETSPEVKALQAENAALKTQVEQLQATVSEQTKSTQASAREDFLTMAATKLDAGLLADMTARYDSMAETPVSQEAFVSAISALPKIEAANPKPKLTLFPNPENKAAVEQDDADEQEMYAATETGRRAKEIAAKKAA